MLPTHGETILQWQQHVEDDRVVLGDRRLIRRAQAVADDVDGVRLFTQALGEHLCRARLVLHQQDSHECDDSVLGANRGAG